MNDWAGIKKAINNDLSTPLNELITDAKNSINSNINILKNDSFNIISGNIESKNFSSSSVNESIKILDIKGSGYLLGFYYNTAQSSPSYSVGFNVIVDGKATAFPKVYGSNYCYACPGLSSYNFYLNDKMNSMISDPRAEYVFVNILYPIRFNESLVINPVFQNVSNSSISNSTIWYVLSE